MSRIIIVLLPGWKSPCNLHGSLSGSSAVSLWSAGFQLHLSLHLRQNHQCESFGLTTTALNMSGWMPVCRVKKRTPAMFVAGVSSVVINDKAEQMQLNSLMDPQQLSLQWIQLTVLFVFHEKCVCIHMFVDTPCNVKGKHPKSHVPQQWSGEQCHAKMTYWRGRPFWMLVRKV